MSSNIRLTWVLLLERLNKKRFAVVFYYYYYQISKFEKCNYGRMNKSRKIVPPSGSLQWIGKEEKGNGFYICELSLASGGAVTIRKKERFAVFDQNSRFQKWLYGRTNESRKTVPIPGSSQW